MNKEKYGHILPFGQEKVDVISASRMQELRETYKDPIKFSYAIMRDIYFSNRSPNNNNVRYVKISDDERAMVVWTGEIWKRFANEDIVHDMLVSYEKAKAIHDPPNEETQKAIDAMVRRVKL